MSPTCRFSDVRRVALALLLAACTASTAAARTPAAPLTFGFGKAATPAEIAGWDIDVRPDGTGLPPGRGTVATGQEIYDAKCASCHGTFGESNDYLALAGGIGTLGSSQPIRTTGSKLNYATTLFDYIRRAMPFANPKSLTDDEVYALTAYVLHLNDILAADAALDRESLPRVRMPNRDGFTTAHGFMRREGRPDVHNTACMRDCAREVRLSSEMPEHARDSHGNLAEQTRGVGAGDTTAVKAPLATEGDALAKQMACMSCHAVVARVVGPAFRDVAARYAGQPDAEGRLLKRIRSGGVGTWGDVPMPAQPHIKDAEARALARWILSGAR